MQIVPVKKDLYENEHPVVQARSKEQDHYSAPHLYYTRPDYRLRAICDKLEAVGYKL